MATRYRVGDKVVVEDKSLGYGDAVGTVRRIVKLAGRTYYVVRFRGMPTGPITYEGRGGRQRTLRPKATGEYMLPASLLRKAR